jgi:hypothetical protein
MSLDYIHIPINNIEEFININNRINEIQKTISNNILLKFDFDNNINNNKIQIKNGNFYIKTNQTSELYNKYNCPICYECIFKNNLKILLCKHSFCIKCFKNWSNTCIEKSLILTCPLCREKILNTE